MKNWKRAILASAVASMFAAGAAYATDMKDAKAGDKDVKCSGVNECAGKGACAGADNSCAGKNGCAKKGWVKEANADACTKKGGKVVAAAEKKGDAKKTEKKM